MATVSHAGPMGSQAADRRKNATAAQSDEAVQRDTVMTSIYVLLYVITRLSSSIICIRIANK